jgi:hypothetical protein
MHGQKTACPGCHQRLTASQDNPHNPLFPVNNGLFVDQGQIGAVENAPIGHWPLLKRLIISCFLSQLLLHKSRISKSDAAALPSG